MLSQLTVLDPKGTCGSMQPLQHHYSHPTLQIRDRLLSGLDPDYTVIKMDIIMEVLSELEHISITKEALEISRLGKHINELRRKSSDKMLATRAKSLVKKWRQLLTSNSTSSTDQTNSLVNGNSNGQLSSPKISRPNNQLTDIGSKYSNNQGLSPGLVPSGIKSSSLTSSASTSPGLSISRPVTPASSNTSQPVSPYLRSQAVAGGKRAFQNGDEKSLSNGLNGKTSKLNGTSEADDHSLGPDHLTDPQEKLVSPPVIGKKVRKAKVKVKSEDLLQDRLASILKTSGKLRTTEELVKDMALKSASAGSDQRVSPEPSLSDSESKSPEVLQTSPHPEPQLSNQDGVTLEDIMAKLPVINAAEVLASYVPSEDEDSDLEVEGLIPALKEPPDTSSEKLEQLHVGKVECLSGNFNHDGNFQEWHEVVTKTTLNDDLLPILPYCLIE